MNINKIQNNLKEGISIEKYNDDDINYIKNPIGKAIYKDSLEKTIKNNYGSKSNRGRKKAENPVKWSDKITCKVCGKTILRSNQTTHKKTKFHQAHVHMSEQVIKLLKNN
jgi:hypothetical protein